MFPDEASLDRVLQQRVPREVQYKDDGEVADGTQATVQAVKREIDTGSAAVCVSPPKRVRVTGKRTV